MRKKGVLGLSLVASLCLLPEGMLADAFITLESVTLMEEALSGIGEAKVISKESLEKTQAKEMKEVFKNEPSVLVGGGARNAQRVYLRGIEGNNLNITIDGAKQGGSLFQHMGDVGSIDPSLLKSVEVSTIAGADKGNGALGGSIAFETVDAQDLLKEGQELGATLRGGYYSASDGVRGGTSVYGKSGHVGILLDVSGLNQHDYRTGKGGDADNTAVKDRNYFFKASLLDYYDHSLKLGATHTTNDGHYIAGSSGSDMGVPDPNAATSHIITTRDTYTLDYRYNPQSEWIDLKANVYYNDRNYDNKTNHTDVSSQNYGGNIKNTLGFATGDVNHLFSVGMDYDIEDGVTKASSGDITNTSKTLGAFVQGSSNYQIATLRYGVRLDEYSIEYGPSNEVTGHEFSPNVGLDIELIEGLTAFTNYREAIKIGSVIPVQWLSNANAATTFNGTLNGDLEPESSKQIEGGLRYKTKSLLADTDSIVLGVSLFKTTISDLISKNPAGGPTIANIYNSDVDVISKGYELKASYALAPFKTSLSFLHANVEDENGVAILSRRIAGSVGDTLVWDTSWRMNPQFSLGYTLTSVGKLDDEIKRDSYVVHDLSLEYKPASLKNLTLYFAINNLFDKEYYAQTSFESGDTLVEEAGRDFRASFKYVF
ncbi:TonB-dependent receptor domain-containing protein [Sulfurospirillum barnesii]|uniref:Outer membrane receptor protein n=1 Tax=Sulfurospirillum barnesii (strain ATCC 700032 / DSM 10660 / SES-3) TaxID=760154 RepID=I3XY90_SULBS|nr:TonB-dependent receptor [Sulfurospirillum barnesii]AFL68914.1 outer membrane receptor protein [Sulfurospirillum barnesii SES-3]